MIKCGLFEAIDIADQLLFDNHRVKATYKTKNALDDKMINIHTEEGSSVYMLDQMIEINDNGKAVVKYSFAKNETTDLSKTMEFLIVKVRTIRASDFSTI